MNILVAMDDNFVRSYSVMIASLCLNHPDEEIFIHIPYTERLSEQGLKHVTGIASHYGAHVRTYDFAEGLLPAMRELPVGMWSIEMFFRLFAQDFIDVSEDRILWLDGDIIVNGNIRALYDMDLGDAYYAACEDKAISRGKIREEYDNLGWADEIPYMNSGVLLIHLAKLRQDGITQQSIAEYALANKDKLHYPDQYVLNGLFQKKIIAADAFLYNCQVSSYPYTLGNRILRESAILHFPGYRPWNVNYQRHYSAAISGDIWWRYARKCGEGQGYLRWKISNTIRVKPWQLIYRFSRRFTK